MKPWLSLCLALCMAFGLATSALAQAAVPGTPPSLDVPWEKAGETLLADAPQGASLLSPVTIQPAQWASGCAAGCLSADYYRFTIFQPGVVNFTFRRTQAGSGFYWDVSLGRDSNDSVSVSTTHRVFLRNIVSYQAGLRSNAAQARNHTRESAAGYWTISVGYDDNGAFVPRASKKVALDSASSGTLQVALTPGTYFVKIAPYTKYGRLAPIGRECSFPLTGTVGPAWLKGFVTRLYDKCLGRQPGASGMNTSMNLLNSGWSHRQRAQGFPRSVEFKNICARCGMTPW